METLTCDICKAGKIKSEIKGRSRNEIISNMLRHIKQNHPAHYVNIINMARENQEKIFKEQRDKIRFK